MQNKTLAEEFALKPIPKDTHQKYRLTNPRLNKEIFNKTYVYAEDFKSKLHEFDKQRIYQSEVSNRLGI